MLSGQGSVGAQSGVSAAFLSRGGGGGVGSRVENEKQLLPPAVSWERGGEGVQGGGL